MVRSIYDPTLGTGGMVSTAEEHLLSLNPNARLVMYGQELNSESYAICKADTLIKGQAIANIILGNTLSAVPISRLFKNEDFGYRTITVERPERDAKGKIVLGTKGKTKGQPVPDSSLRDTENVPLSEELETYFKREVLPHAPDAWIDNKKTKTGYEIPFNRHFYVFHPPRPLAEIDAELKGVTDRILTLIGGLTK